MRAVRLVIEIQDQVLEVRLEYVARALRQVRHVVDVVDRLCAGRLLLPLQGPSVLHRYL